MNDSSTRRRSSVATALTLLVVGLGVAFVAASAQPAAAASSSGTGTAPSVQTSDEPVEVPVTVTYTRSEDPAVLEGEVVVPEDEVVPGAYVDARFVGAEEFDDWEGFEPGWGTLPRLEMTDEAGPATATFTRHVDDGKYEVTEGSWSLFRIDPYGPKPDQSVTVDGETVTVELSIEREIEADELYVGPHGFASIGPHEKATVSTGEGSITVVHPEPVQTRHSPDRVAEYLAALQDRFGAGDVDADRAGFAHPDIDAGGGLAIRDDTFLIQSPGSPYGQNSHWVHEFFHVTDGTYYGSTDKRLGNDMTWFTEGFGDYADTLLPVLAGDGQREDLQGRFDYAKTFEEPLADQTDSAAEVNYVKGSAVLIALDAEIRLASDGGADFSDVHERMTAQAARDEDVTLEDFLGMVKEVADAETAAQAEEWITTSASPDLWTASEHRDAFEQRPDLQVERSDVRVRNPAGEEPLDPDDPRELSPNEVLVVEFEVTNHGDATGWYAPFVEVGRDGEYVFRYGAGAVEPGETTTVDVPYNVTEPGTYDVYPSPGDSFSVRATLEPVDGTTPRDVNGDGLYRDFNADGVVTQTDVSEFFAVQHRDSVQDHWPAYDFNENGDVGLDDVRALFEYA